jgi:hypothetical protein
MLGDGHMVVGQPSMARVSSTSPASPAWADWYSHAGCVAVRTKHVWSGGGRALECWNAGMWGGVGMRVYLADAGVADEGQAAASSGGAHEALLPLLRQSA